MVSSDGPPVSNPITGTWRNSFADKDKKGRDLQQFDRVEELTCDPFSTIYCGSVSLKNIVSNEKWYYWR
jgi:hypothetical protein